MSSDTSVTRAHYDLYASTLDEYPEYQLFSDYVRWTDAKGRAYDLWLRVLCQRRVAWLHARRPAAVAPDGGVEMHATFCH